MHPTLIDRWQRAASDDGFPWVLEYFPVPAQEFPFPRLRELSPNQLILERNFEAQRPRNRGQRENSRFFPWEWEIARSAYRCPQHVFDIVRPGPQHDQAVEAERDAGARREPVLEGGEEVFVDRAAVAIERLLAGLVGDEASALLGRAAARQRGHRQRIVVEDRRRTEAEMGLDPLEEDAEEQRLPVISGMR